MDIKKYKIKVTYRKTGFVRLFSHLDIARFLERALRRSDLPYYLTKGFNPHPKISFYRALKLGEEGENEAVFYFDEDVQPDMCKEKLLSNFPKELEIVRVDRIE